MKMAFIYTSGCGSLVNKMSSSLKNSREPFEFLMHFFSINILRNLFQKCNVQIKKYVWY